VLFTAVRLALQRDTWVGDGQGADGKGEEGYSMRDSEKGGRGQRGVADQRRKEGRCGSRALLNIRPTNELRDQREKRSYIFSFQNTYRLQYL